MRKCVIFFCEARMFCCALALFREKSYISIDKERKFISGSYTFAVKCALSCCKDARPSIGLWWNTAQSYDFWRNVPSALHKKRSHTLWKESVGGHDEHITIIYEKRLWGRDLGPYFLICFLPPTMRSCPLCVLFTRRPVRSNAGAEVAVAVVAASMAVGSTTSRRKSKM